MEPKRDELLQAALLLSFEKSSSKLGSWYFDIEKGQTDFSLVVSQILKSENTQIDLEKFMGLMGAEARRQYFQLQKDSLEAKDFRQMQLKIKNFKREDVWVSLQAHYQVIDGNEYILGSLEDISLQKTKEVQVDAISKGRAFYTQMTSLVVGSQSGGFLMPSFLEELVVLMQAVYRFQSSSVWLKVSGDPDSANLYECHAYSGPVFRGPKGKRLDTNNLKSFLSSLKMDPISIFNSKVDVEVANELASLLQLQGEVNLVVSSFCVNGQIEGFVVCSKEYPSFWSFDEHSALMSLSANISMRITHQEMESLVEKRTESLKKREIELNLLVGSLEDIVFEMTLDGTYKNVWCSNDALLFLPKDQFLGKSAFDLFPSLAVEMEKAFQKAWFSGVEASFEYQVAELSSRWFRAKVRKLEVASSEDKKVLLVIQDITDYKMAQLRDEEIFKLINSAAIVSITDVNGIIQFANATFESISGFSSHELIGYSHSVVNSKYHPPQFFEEMWKTIKSGKIWKGEICNRRKDGSLYWVDSTISPLKSSDGEIEKFIAIRFDITQRKLAEAQTAHAAKMVALGEMAGGIAHEINNPLAIIMGKANYLVKMHEAGDIDKERSLEFLGSIERTADRIAKTVRGLRFFARAADNDPFEEASLKTIIEDTLELCSQRIKMENVTLKVEIEGGDCRFDCRSAQVSQVLLNLIVNALDAIFSFEDKWIHIHASTDEKFLNIQVIDSGMGISPDIGAKLFEPFFTTKGVGKGTGLGLSISKGIAEEHGGSLSIDSQASNTTFLFKLKLRHEGLATLKKAHH